MPATANAHRVIQMAQRLYQWYSQPTDDIDALKEAINDADVAAEIHTASFINCALVLKRIYYSEDFSRIREALLLKWSPRFERQGGISTEDAQAVLLEWAESLDHDLLFSHGVTPGRTHAQKHVPPSDFVTSYHRTRSAWTLHFTVRGAVEYSAGVPLLARRGDFVLISPDASVHYKRHCRYDEWLHYWALFQPEPRWTELMQWPARSYGMYVLSIDRDEDLLPFESLFEQMLQLNGDTRPLLDRLLGNLLEQILIRAQDFVVAEQLPATDPRVLKASEYMLKNLRTVRLVSEVAAVCNVSESRLAHLFQQHLGMGIQEYRNCLRMQTAKRLLATTGELIAVIARRVGYDDPVQFSKFFSRSLGCSPRQFRAAFSGNQYSSRAAQQFKPAFRAAGQRQDRPPRQTARLRRDQAIVR